MKQLYGLIGYPLGHSFSARFFAEKFQRENIDAEYLNLEIPRIEQLSDVLQEHPLLCGFNVTIPHKQNIIPLLDALSPEAEEIGAVNVVTVGRRADKTVLTGHNSDVIGFTRSLQPLLCPHHRRALILGTGGASKAVRVGLQRLGLETLNVSRTKKQGQITYGEVTADLLRQYSVIVNCSPVGMYPNVDEAPELPYHLLTPDHLLYDLVYNPQETAFMKLGAAQGAMVKNGLEMLHLQALAAWDIWQLAREE